MNLILVALKGAVMGAANIIPGVSGGTIAFVTGIYDTLINSMKALDHHALGDLFKFRIKDFYKRTNFGFLLALGIGAIVGIVGIAKVLERLFISHEMYVWAFFFGLILASAWLVGKRVQPWKMGSVVSFIVGLLCAVVIAVVCRPASENDSFLYLILCGAVAFCSMIVPGLSGSFVLVLLGNYLLILGAISRFVDAIKGGEVDELLEIGMNVMLPVGIGVVIGFIVFSRVVSWLFDHHKNTTIALLTGFIVGSLLIIWPWKNEVHLLGDNGEKILRKGEYVLSGYQWLLPDFVNTETWSAVGLMIVGAGMVVVIEKVGKKASI